jgi:hypothetical protein
LEQAPVAGQVLLVSPKTEVLEQPRISIIEWQRGQNGDYWLIFMFSPKQKSSELSVKLPLVWLVVNLY